MNAITDTELRVRGFDVLAKAFGDVDAERFIALASSEPFDYTEWRRDHLFVGATVDSIMDEAEAMESDKWHMRVTGQE